MGNRKHSIGSIGFLVTVAVIILSFLTVQSGAVNQWFMPNEDAGSFQLKTLRVKQIRAPQASASADRTLTLYSPALSGTVSGTFTNSATQTGGTYTSSTITSGTITGTAKYTQDATVINSRTQLSNFSADAATAGGSIYQTEIGKRYIVDLYALAQGLVSGVSGAFSGVTLILPNASSANSEGTVEIELAVTGNTGYPAWSGSATGTSIVWVYPYSAGTTSYAKGTVLPQTMQTYALEPGNSGTTVIGIGNKNMASGASFWSLDKPGESATFAVMYNSQVSAWPKRVTALN